MSVVLQPNSPDEAAGVLIDDNSTFNLPILQKLLNQEAESAKKWAKRYKLRSIKGRTWIFTGRLVRQALERAMLEDSNGDCEA